MVSSLNSNLNLNNMTLNSNKKGNFNKIYIENIGKILREIQKQNYYRQKKEYKIFDTKINALSLLTDIGLGIWLQGFLSSLLPFMQSKKGAFLDKVTYSIQIAKQNFCLDYLAFKNALQLFILSHNFIFYEFFKTDAEYFDYELLLNIILRYSPFMFEDIKKRDEIKRLKRYAQIYLILQTQYCQKTHNFQKELNLKEFVDLLLTVIQLIQKFYPVTGYILFVKYVFLWEKYKNKKILKEFEGCYFDDRIKVKKEEENDDDENKYITIDTLMSNENYKEDFDDDDEGEFKSIEEMYFYEQNEETSYLNLLELVEKAINEILTEEEKKVIYYHFYCNINIYERRNSKKIQKELGYSIGEAQRIFERSLFKLRNYFNNYNLNDLNDIM